MGIYWDQWVALGGAYDPNNNRHVELRRNMENEMREERMKAPVRRQPEWLENMQRRDAANAASERRIAEIVRNRSIYD